MACISTVLFVLFAPVVAASPALTSCTYTSSDGTGALSPCPPLSPASSTWTLSLDSTKRQAIDGFGASFTDATTFLFDALSPSQQDAIYEKLFTSASPDAIKLELMRTTVGQSDLTPESDGRWSFDENEGQPDPDLEHFALTDPGERMLKALTKMQNYTSSVTLLGSIWSPPGWMKQNNNLRWQYITQYVDYILSYLKTYAAAGVPLSAITLQNEPLHTEPVSGPAWTMYMDASYAAILSNMTAEAIRDAKLGTEIWAYDHNTDHPEYPQYVLDNAPAVTNVAWHCYASGDGGFKTLESFASTNPTAKQYMTECWLHSLDSEGFFDLPQFIMRPIQCGASGAMAWTLAGSVDLDVSFPGGCTQCTGLIQVDMKSGTYELTHDFYAIGQFSRFVSKGARYLRTSGDHIYEDNTGVESAGFKNPSGEIVVVVLNKFSNELELTLQVEGAEILQTLYPNSVTTLTLTAIH